MPLAYVQIPKALARGETLVACIIGVMLLVAVGCSSAPSAPRAMRAALAMWRCSSTRSRQHWRALWRHHGAARGVSAGLLFAATLACLHHSTRRTTDADNDNNTEVRENVLWQSEGMAQVRPQGDGIALSFRLDVPAGLPGIRARPRRPPRLAPDAGEPQRPPWHLCATLTCRLTPRRGIATAGG